MVFVKVRETYDLHTLRNKMSIIGVHTPKAGIIKRNYPGLLMQCKMYRPVSCDIKMACASMLPLDPQGVGLTEGDVAPEDVFNPILYKAVSNLSMSQIEMFILQNTAGYTTFGDSLDATNDGVTDDDFNIYYGLLSNTHEWKHANPQSGMAMASLRPLVYETLNTIGAFGVSATDGETPSGNVPGIDADGTTNRGISNVSFRGNAKSMPWMPCTVPVGDSTNPDTLLTRPAGFSSSDPLNAQIGVPAPKIYCGIVIVPPSRLHQLFYRLVCEWTLEFSSLRPISEITNYNGLAAVGNLQHYMDYDFGNSKMLTESTSLVDTSDGSGITKVM